MSKSLLQQKMAEALPRFRSMEGGYFVDGSPDYVAVGYLYEATRSGAWIWRFVYPLFDPYALGVHLTYSYRLPGYSGHLSSLTLKPVEMADQFVSRVSEFDKAAPAVGSLSAFCSYCEAEPGITRNEHSALGLGYAFALNRQPARATPYLEYAASRLSGAEAAQAREMLALVAKDLRHAQKILQESAELKKLELRLA